MAATDHPPLPAELLAMLGARLGSIHGVRLRPAAQPWRSSDLKPGHTGYKLGVDGWSPTLHEIDMTWRLSLDLSRSAADLDAAAIRQTGHQTSLQRSRAADGLALGHAYPMPVDGPPGGVAVRHLHTDASGMGLRIAALADASAPAGGALGDIAHKLQAIHRAVSATGADTLAEAGSEISDHGPFRTVHVGLDNAVDLSGGIAMTGRRVTLFDVHLPDTVLAALPGRRLFQLAPTHPVLDGRTIESVAQMPGWIDVVLTPCDVAMDDVWDLPRDEALDHLYAAIATKC